MTCVTFASHLHQAGCVNIWNRSPVIFFSQIKSEIFMTVPVHFVTFTYLLFAFVIHVGLCVCACVWMCMSVSGCVAHRQRECVCVSMYEWLPIQFFILWNVIFSGLKTECEPVHFFFFFSAMRCPGAATINTSSLRFPRPKPKPIFRNRGLGWIGSLGPKKREIFA